MQREFICGDCMNFLPDFPDNYFDVAVVDPPYGIREHGGKECGYRRQVARLMDGKLHDAVEFEILASEFKR